MFEVEFIAFKVIGRMSTFWFLKLAYILSDNKVALSSLTVIVYLL